MPLRALGYGGRVRYRTGLMGWYLRRDGTIAVSQDAAYLILKTPDSALGRLRGVTIGPSTPPLVVGKGGRDGDSIDLKALLAQRLTAGGHWPQF